MKDRELIDAVIDGTLPKIKDIRDVYAAQAEKRLDAEIAAGDWPELDGLPPGTPDPALRAALERSLYGPPLMDMVVQVLWAVLSKAESGVFIVNEQRVATACASLDEAEIQHATGFDAAHVRPILDRTAEAFIEVVRTRGPIDITIDGTPIRLVIGT